MAVVPLAAWGQLVQEVAEAGNLRLGELRVVPVDTRVGPLLPVDTCYVQTTTCVVVTAFKHARHNTLAIDVRGRPPLLTTSHARV